VPCGASVCNRKARSVTAENLAAEGGVVVEDADGGHPGAPRFDSCGHAGGPTTYDRQIGLFDDGHRSPFQNRSSA
jgi:hypothetical protein